MLPQIIPTYSSEEEARANCRPDAHEPWLGYSVGWYEEGTLRVESININPQQLRQSAIPITTEGRIIERTSRYSDDGIVYQLTVEDSNIYLRPWTDELSFYATEDRLYEYACHEGNYQCLGHLRAQERQS